MDLDLTTPIPSDLSPRHIPINYEDDENDLRMDSPVDAMDISDPSDNRDYFRKRVMENEKLYNDGIELICER